MDHFESIVFEYLRADRSLFVNTQCCIQLNPGDNPDTSGPHWYCDAVAVGFKEKAVYLCEITYASPPNSLMKRLSAWNKDWPSLCLALVRDCAVPSDWPVRPWLFLPETLQPRLASFLGAMAPLLMPQPKMTRLEDVLPWRYRSWNRRSEEDSAIDA
jgi:hypothetical protein